LSVCPFVRLSVYLFVRLSVCLVQKIILNYIFLLNTVKPVYNGHPWDLKKVAV
jgi:hypothetical protein